MKNIIFSNYHYENLIIPPNSIVYVDPPYQNTVSYKTNKIDYIDFWNWVRMQTKENLVFISEYKAPDDFKCIEQFNVKCGVSKIKRDSRIERLFILDKCK